MSRTGKDFQLRAKERHIKRWNIGRCGICEYDIGYDFLIDGNVIYDNDCYCTYYGEYPINISSWDKIAQRYNSQTDPDIIRKMKKFWAW